MDLRETLDAPCDPEVLFAAVDDLARYPSWLGIVTRAEAEAEADADGGPAWSIDLRGRIGPLARSKRLRMVRTLHDPPHRARFERRELHGRTTSPWVLEAEVGSLASGSRLTMHLHYGGTFGAGLLERMLHDEIERSRPRLMALVAP